MNVYDLATRQIAFELCKHGQCYGHTTVESRVDSLTNNELLELISDAVEERISLLRISLFLSQGENP